MNTCFYCGKSIKVNESNNADDFGLHKETKHKVSCLECDRLITLTIRCLSSAIRSKNLHHKKYHIQVAIENLQKTLEEL